MRVVATTSPATEEVNNSTPATTGMLTFSLIDALAGTNAVVVDTITEVSFSIAVLPTANASAGGLTESDFRLEVLVDDDSNSSTPDVWQTLAASNPGVNAATLNYKLTLPAGTSSRQVRVVALNETAVPHIVEGVENLVATISSLALPAASTATTRDLNVATANSATVAINDNDQAFVRVVATTSPATEEVNNSTPATTGMLTFSLIDALAGTNAVVVDTITEVSFSIAVLPTANASAGGLTESDFRLEFWWMMTATVAHTDVWQTLAASNPGVNAATLNYKLTLPAGTSSRQVRVVALNETAVPHIVEGSRT